MRGPKRKSPTETFKTWREARMGLQDRLGKNPDLTWFAWQGTGGYIEHGPSLPAGWTHPYWKVTSKTWVPVYGEDVVE